MEFFKKVVVYSGIFCFVVFGSLQALDQRWSEEDCTNCFEALACLN